MNIIKPKTLIEYSTKYPQAKRALHQWYNDMRINEYSSIIDLRRVYPSADSLKGSDLICFNIKGNSFRLIVRITWGKTVFIRELLTHSEYTAKYC